jgi:hypothetical protein
MTNWFLPFIFASALGPSMLAVGILVGRQRTVATLAQLLEQGAFRVVSAEGTPVSVKELARGLGVAPARPGVAAGVSIGVVLAAACIAALLAFLALSSRH